MDNNFPTCLAITLKHEGGWSDHPSDPGGATMKGVTLKTFSAFKGRRCTKTQLRAISDPDVQAIYRNGYWDAVPCGPLASGVDLIAFDVAVNSGPARIKPWLASTNGLSPIERIKVLCARRRGFWQALKTFNVFGKGWLRRGADIEANALKMAGGVYAVGIARPEATKAKQTNAAAATATTASPAALTIDQAQALPSALLWVFGGVIACVAIIFIYNTLAHRARETALTEASNG